MSYLDSGFNANLIRTTYNNVGRYDNANIEELIFGSSIGSNQIANLSASKIITGKFGLIPSDGDTGMLFDADENRIVINDGSFDRILIGRLVGGF